MLYGKPLVIITVKAYKCDRCWRYRKRRAVVAWLGILDGDDLKPGERTDLYLCEKCAGELNGGEDWGTLEAKVKRARQIESYDNAREKPMQGYRDLLEAQ